ncbi:MAG: alpha-galactosidase [Aureispira sp.]|nr:alpha-galactosidase [Aureispira sp.]
MRTKLVLLIFIVFSLNLSAQVKWDKLIIKYSWLGSEDVQEAVLDWDQLIETDHFRLISSQAFRDLDSDVENEVLNFRIEPKVQMKLESVQMTGQFSNFELEQFYCNGFQSWTTSQELTKNDKQKPLAPILNAYSKNTGDYGYYKYSKKKGVLHSWSYTYGRKGDNYTFLTSLDETSGFTRFVWDTRFEQLSIEKDCEGKWLQVFNTYPLLKVLKTQGTQQEVYEKMNRHYYVKGVSKAEPAIGWTSWYHYYDKITEEIILDNLEAFASRKVPIDVFQIDDGFQQAVGDWLTPNKKFPKGMKYIADQIHDKGYKAGLWLAPFVAAKNSEVYKQHPDWFVRDKKGKHIPVAINVIWKGKYFAFDIYNKEVQAHLKKTLQTVVYDWGYDLIKVDFLFGVCLQGRYDKTRGEIMEDAMSMMREWVGDKLILGCGVPLMPSFKQVDYCRVGNDAHLAWEFPVLKGLRAHERPSTWSTLTNTIMRAPLSGMMFLNDPDVFILRSKKTKLSDAEKYTLLLTNVLLGEVLFTSDNIEDYTTEQMQQYLSIFPYRKKTNIQIYPENGAYRISFEIDDRKYMALINLSDKKVEMNLPKADYYHAASNKLKTVENWPLEKHQSVCLYVSDSTKTLEVLGGQNYLFSGAETDHFLAKKGKYGLQKHSQAQKFFPTFIRVNSKEKEFNINGETYEIKDFGTFRGIQLDE